MGRQNKRADNRTPAAKGTGCEWFLMCTNDAVGVVVNPWGETAVCQRCADSVGLTLKGESE